VLVAEVAIELVLDVLARSPGQPEARREVQELIATIEKKRVRAR